VTTQTVQVTQLAGAEFFDAVVSLDHVSAVTVRGRAKYHMRSVTLGD
jgi:hypothetical protein